MTDDAIKLELTKELSDYIVNNLDCEETNIFWSLEHMRDFVFQRLENTEHEYFAYEVAENLFEHKRNILDEYRENQY